MDFYIVLGLERAATIGEIKRAYKRLARRYHPDVNPGDRTAAAHFRRIAEAYETLSDPERRRRYDASGSAEPIGFEAVSFGFEGFDFSSSTSGPSASTFGDLFADILHQRGGRQPDGAERGADIHQSLELDFDEAMRGGQRRLTVARQEECRACRGAGVLSVDESRCLHCHGTGAVKSARGHMVFSKPCTSCGGTGVRRQQRCQTCGGQGVEMRSETLTVSLPAGLADGASLRVPGKGHVGRGGGEAGDLQLTIRVKAHPLFTREGDDLLVTVAVAVHEAALGAKIDVPSPDGSARLRVPPGTQSGQRFRLRERGAPSPRTGQRGDLVIEVRLVLPRVLDERSKELMREFGKINSEDPRQ